MKEKLLNMPYVSSEKTTAHPGIYIPPPLIYVAVFFVAIFLQKVFPLQRSWLNTREARLAGLVFIAVYVLLAFLAIRQFVLSKNTLVTIKPAASLQTKGIYSFSRNPMYLSLLSLYSGIAVFAGGWWNFILLPLLVFIIRVYVIQKEENYLRTAFGKDYDAYRKKVRRWI